YHGARRRGWPVAAAGVAPLVAVEWLYPALFPLRLGNALVGRTLWIQAADLGGPLLLSALAALANAALFETWRWLRGARRPPLGTSVLAGAVAAGGRGYGGGRGAGRARA